jgi:hypothetical protein
MRARMHGAIRRVLAIQKLEASQMVKMNVKVMPTPFGLAMTGGRVLALAKDPGGDGRLVRGHLSRDECQALAPAKSDFDALPAKRRSG